MDGGSFVFGGWWREGLADFGADGCEGAEGGGGNVYEAFIGLGEVSLVCIKGGKMRRREEENCLLM